MEPGAIITLTRDDDEQHTFELLDWIEFAGEEFFFFTLFCFRWRRMPTRW